MELQVGDWVKTDTGQAGQVVLISRLSAFVEIQIGGRSTTVSCLLSQLTKIDSPPESQDSK
jgi:preprotein translocase subunit YajC